MTRFLTIFLAISTIWIVNSGPNARSELPVTSRQSLAKAVELFHHDNGMGTAQQTPAF